MVFSEHANAYKLIYRDAGVHSVKVTHDRTVAIQNMSNLTPHQISSFTKHIIDNKLSSAYQAEVDFDACTVQSGFRPGEEWFVPEANIEIPPPLLREWTKYLLPRIDTWRAERTGRHGDKSPCADNFLNETIPFLVEVIVQCGIYFILEFPTHEMAQLLMGFPGYEEWAHRKRQECANLSATRVEDRMQVMEEATRGSYERLNQRFDELVGLLSQVVEQNNNLVQQNEYLQQQFRNFYQHPPAQQPPQPPQQPQQQPPPQQQPAPQQPITAATVRPLPL